jgi:sRNA-binding regulator protein Hfq
VAVGPLSLVERVHVADGLVQGSVLFQAVDLFDLYALLVKQDVEDIVYASD